MIEIQPILKKDIEEVSLLAVACFVEDPFYQKLSDDTTVQKLKMMNIFRKSIGICIDHGFAYGIKEDGEFVAFSIWFDYDNLKKHYPAEYSHIFYNGENVKKVNDMLKKETDAIDAIINGSSEYMYLLALGVKDEFRRNGYASILVNSMLKAYPHYSFFADVFNQSILGLYKRLGFDIIGEAADECKFVICRSAQDAVGEGCICGDDDATVWLAVPSGLKVEGLGIEVRNEEKARVPFVEALGTENPYFRSSLYARSNVRLVEVSYQDLLKYQRYINVSFFEEIKIEIGNKVVFIYTTNRGEFPGIDIAQIQTAVYAGKKEWNVIPDVCTSIPIEYTDLNLLNTATDNSFMIDRILKAMDFRTTYEAGIPIKDLDTKIFKYRIERFYLGRVKIQMLAEKGVCFDGFDEDVEYGAPIEVELIVSVDKQSKCGVLHLISFSFGLLLTQYLDSVSRNQINIVNDSKNINLYHYLEQTFGIEKKGTAKHFLTVPQDRKMIPQDLLASVLYCETLYDDGESLGKVVDKEILDMLANPNGHAQYNYAAGYSYSNILIQMSDTFQCDLYRRIKMESVTLFYIELLLFEESAIGIANDEIVRFLREIDERSPKDTLKEINRIITKHVLTIDFWNIQVNYPSSQKSLDELSQSFRINEVRSTFERNKKELMMIYDIRSDIVDKGESNLMSSVVMVLTAVSVLNLFLNPDNHFAIGVTIICAGVGLYLGKKYTRNQILIKK